MSSPSFKAPASRRAFFKGCLLTAPFADRGCQNGQLILAEMLFGFRCSDQQPHPPWRSRSLDGVRPPRCPMLKAMNHRCVHRQPSGSCRSRKQIALVAFRRQAVIASRTRGCSTSCANRCQQQTALHDATNHQPFGLRSAIVLDTLSSRHIDCASDKAFIFRYENDTYRWARIRLSLRIQEYMPAATPNSRGRRVARRTSASNAQRSDPGRSQPILIHLARGA